MIHAIIFGALFLLMLAFVAGGEKVCDWYWRRRISRSARNDKKEGSLT